MDSSQLSRAAASYTARLDRTLKTLQDRVKEQEAALENVNSRIQFRRDYINFLTASSFYSFNRN